MSDAKTPATFVERVASEFNIDAKIVVVLLSHARQYLGSDKSQLVFEALKFDGKSRLETEFKSSGDDVRKGVLDKFVRSFSSTVKSIQQFPPVIFDLASLALGGGAPTEQDIKSVIEKIKKREAEEKKLRQEDIEKSAVGMDSKFDQKKFDADWQAYQNCFTDANLGKILRQARVVADYLKSEHEVAEINDFASSCLDAFHKDILETMDENTAKEARGLLDRFITFLRDSKRSLSLQLAMEATRLGATTYVVPERARAALLSSPSSTRSRFGIDSSSEAPSLDQGAAENKRKKDAEDRKVRRAQSLARLKSQRKKKAEPNTAIQQDQKRPPQFGTLVGPPPLMRAYSAEALAALRERPKEGGSSPDSSPVTLHGSGSAHSDSEHSDSDASEKKKKEKEDKSKVETKEKDESAGPIVSVSVARVPPWGSSVIEYKTPSPAATVTAIRQVPLAPQLRQRPPEYCYVRLPVAEDKQMEEEKKPQELSDEQKLVMAAEYWRLARAPIPMEIKGYGFELGGKLDQPGNAVLKEIEKDVEDRGEDGKEEPVTIKVVDEQKRKDAFAKALSSFVADNLSHPVPVMQSEEERKKEASDAKNLVIAQLAKLSTEAERFTTAAGVWARRSESVDFGGLASDSKYSKLMHYKYDAKSPGSLREENIRQPFNTAMDAFIRVRVLGVSLDEEKLTPDQRQLYERTKSSIIQLLASQKTTYSMIDGEIAAWCRITDQPQNDLYIKAKTGGFDRFIFGYDQNNGLRCRRQTERVLTPSVDFSGLEPDAQSKAIRNTISIITDESQSGMPIGRFEVRSGEALPKRFEEKITKQPGWYKVASYMYPAVTDPAMIPILIKFRDYDDKSFQVLMSGSGYPNGFQNAVEGVNFRANFTPTEFSSLKIYLDEAIIRSKFEAEYPDAYKAFMRRKDFPEGFAQDLFEFYQKLSPQAQQIMARQFASVLQKAWDELPWYRKFEDSLSSWVAVQLLTFLLLAALAAAVVAVALSAPFIAIIAAASAFLSLITIGASILISPHPQYDINTVTKQSASADAGLEPTSGKLSPSLSSAQAEQRSGPNLASLTSTGSKRRDSGSDVDSGSSPESTAINPVIQRRIQSATAHPTPHPTPTKKNGDNARLDGIRPRALEGVRADSPEDGSTPHSDTPPSA